MADTRELIAMSGKELTKYEIIQNLLECGRLDRRIPRLPVHHDSLVAWL